MIAGNGPKEQPMSNPIETILPVLAATPARWNMLCEALAPELLRRAPTAGEWSALECLLHILDTEKVFTERVEAFLAGVNFPAFNPDEEGKHDTGQPPAALAAEFAALRAESLELLRGLTAADLPRGAVHAELGPVVLDQMLHEWAAHDLMHTVQAERALMQPFIAQCGPWRKYFADHDAAVKR
jgi:hypothetical protein